MTLLLTEAGSSTSANSILSLGLFPITDFRVYKPTTRACFKTGTLLIAFLRIRDIASFTVVASSTVIGGDALNRILNVYDGTVLSGTS